MPNRSGPPFSSRGCSGPRSMISARATWSRFTRDSMFTISPAVGINMYSPPKTAAFRFSATVMGVFQIFRGAPKENVVFRYSPLISNSDSLKGIFCIWSPPPDRAQAMPAESRRRPAAYKHTSCDFSIIPAGGLGKQGCDYRTMRTFFSGKTSSHGASFVSAIQNRPPFFPRV